MIAILISSVGGILVGILITYYLCNHYVSTILKQLREFVRENSKVSTVPGPQGPAGEPGLQGPQGAESISQLETIKTMRSNFEKLAEEIRDDKNYGFKNFSSDKFLIEVSRDRRRLLKPISDIVEIQSPSTYLFIRYNIPASAPDGAKFEKENSTEFTLHNSANERVYFTLFSSVIGENLIRIDVKNFPPGRYAINLKIPPYGNLSKLVQV